MQHFQFLTPLGAGGGGESRRGAVPGICQSSISGMCAAARRRAVHPRPTLALHPILGAQLLRQLLVVVNSDSIIRINYLFFIHSVLRFPAAVDGNQCGVLN